MRVLALVGAAASAFVACGDGAIDSVASIDARLPTGDARPASDAAPPFDASWPEPPYCGKPAIYINALGGMYGPGFDNSTNNTSTLVAAPTWLAGPGMTRGAAIADHVRAVMSPMSVRVTTDDPGTAPHIEVTLVTMGWTFAEPSVAAPFTCMVVPQPVAFVNLASGTITDEHAAARALYAVGAVVGLEPSTTVDNCMNLSSAPCTFSAAAAIAGVCRSETTQQQYNAITAPLACF